MAKLILAFLYLASVKFEPLSLLKEKKIADEAIHELVQTYATDGRKKPMASAYGDLTEWDYLGSIGAFHLVYSAVCGDTWRDYSLTVVQAEENGLKRVDSLSGLKGNEILSGVILGESIQYKQSVTGGAFFELLLEKFPHQKEISGQLKQLRHESIGFFTWETTLDSEGKFAPRKILSFTPNEEGWPPYSGKTYRPEEFEALFLELSQVAVNKI